MGFDETHQAIMEKIRKSPAGPSIVAMAPTNETFAILSFSVRDRAGKEIPITKHVRVIGVDPAAMAKVGGFGEYLVRQKNAEVPTFELDPEAKERFEKNAAWRRHDDDVSQCAGRSTPRRTAGWESPTAGREAG